MADATPPSRANTPTPVTAPPLRRPLDEDHAPAVPSPLNPDGGARARPRAPPREQREKRETLKKREATASTRASTPATPKAAASTTTAASRASQGGHSADSPMRYAIPEPRPGDYEAPRDSLLLPREPVARLAANGVELKRAHDVAWNKKGYRYTPCVADPLFRHKQYYRQTDTRPYGARLSLEDADRWLWFDDSATTATQDKGWRMGRANVVAREGRLYYEARILRGLPADGARPAPDAPPGPHVRVGWARREAPLDAPVGFDGYSYAITDARFEASHRSRASKLYAPLPRGAKSKHMKPRPPHGKPAPVTYLADQHLCQGDVVGLEIQLPSLGLHRTVVDGIYNPAVDRGDGFDPAPRPDPHARPVDMVRDRIPVPYKGNFYFEQLDYHATKPVEAYHDRGPGPKAHPSPNHPDVSLRSLPHSHIKVYKNGHEVGYAFENLLAFLPPASAPSPEAVKTGARTGLDDGMVGYFPAVSLFNGGEVELNFGPDFWCPPADLAGNKDDDDDDDNDMDAVDAVPEGRRLRAIAERYKEQIAEDVVWDIIDEVDFFCQDGGWEYKGEAPQEVTGKIGRAHV